MVLKMEKIIIGVDHGNGNIKTRNEFFPCDFVVSEVKPAACFGNDVLEYNRKFYVLNHTKSPYKIDKTTDEECFIYTLFAIAKEAEDRGLRLIGKDIVLSIGLPPAYMSVMSEKFKDYFMKRSVHGVHFKYKDNQYSFYIKDCYVFPQNYAAAMVFASEYTQKYKKVNCIDIGDGTVDLLVLLKGVPDPNILISIEDGIGKMRSKIINIVMHNTGYTLDDDVIEQVLNKEETVLPEDVIDMINQQTEQWAEMIINRLHKYVPDFRLNPTVFLGGGSLLLEPYIKRLKTVGVSMFIPDIKANAIGFEEIALAMEQEKES